MIKARQLATLEMILCNTTDVHGPLVREVLVYMLRKALELNSFIALIFPQDISLRNVTLRMNLKNSIERMNSRDGASKLRWIIEDILEMQLRFQVWPGSFRGDTFNTEFGGFTLVLSPNGSLQVSLRKIEFDEAVQRSIEATSLRDVDGVRCTTDKKLKAI